MFGLGHAPELILVLAIALIVLGPGKIPEVAQLLGKGIRELRQASADLQKTFDVNELVNPTPAPPPPPAPFPAENAPVAHAPEPAATTGETIAPPALVETAAKPKRARRRTTVEAVGANGDSPAVDRAVGPAKPRARTRASKKTNEPVSLDATA